MAGMAWWQTAVMYQVYPRSFQDGNGDGVGDLRGIQQRLPYLRELGVDAVWISPIFPSPMADFGYDIANYTGIDPLFGTLEEFDALLAGGHEHGLKVLLDLVPNHTSDQHPWFQAARRAPPGRVRGATGISGAIRRRTAGRRTTGCRNSVAARGSGTRAPASTTTMRSWPRSPI